MFIRDNAISRSTTEEGFYYNSNSMSNEWQQLFLNQNFNRRNKFVNLRDNSRFRIGKNLILDRLGIINDHIPLIGPTKAFSPIN